MNYTDITSFEKACEVLNIPANIPTFPHLSENAAKSMLADYKLSIITKAVNGEEKPDFSNHATRKYFLWWEIDKTGAVSLAHVHCRYEYSRVPSRLCFVSREKAEFVADNFLPLYQDYIMGY